MKANFHHSWYLAKRERQRQRQREREREQERERKRERKREFDMEGMKSFFVNVPKGIILLQQERKTVPGLI